MKHALKALLIASALGVGSFAAAGPASAQSVSVYIDVGHISIAYRNGYYDYDRRWHSWRSSAQRNYFRRHYRGRYHDYYHRHDRGRHRGWRHGQHD